VDLTRREFLALTGAAVAVRFDAGVRSPDLAGAISVLHLEDQGHLLESVKGYQRALETLGRPAVAVSESSVLMAANGGALVIIESSVASSDALAAFGVNAGDPHNLWRRGFSPATVRYISYTWPVSVLVRDFSVVVPVSGPGWDQIAEVDGLCVGLTRRIGRGRLVVLGSPLGPVLLGGDREAHEWLGALLGKDIPLTGRTKVRPYVRAPMYVGPNFSSANSHSSFKKR